MYKILLPPLLTISPIPAKKKVNGLYVLFHNELSADKNL